MISQSPELKESSKTLSLAPRSIPFVKASTSNFQKNATNHHVRDSISNGSTNGSKRDPSTHESHDLPLSQAKRCFFDPFKLPKLKHRTYTAVGAGISNPGLNICFMNATLQALTYAPGLSDDMWEGLHSKWCQHRPLRTFCALCKFEKHVQMILSMHKGNIQNQIYMCVKRLIWKNYRIGRQEDAHEFLRFFMDSLNKSCLPLDYQTTNAQNSLKDVDWMTTYISQLFGGWLKNSIICQSCGYRSNKYDPYLDFITEISGSNTIEHAFSRFVRPESLSGGNRYMCPVCEEKQDALKRMVIYKAPRILTIPLKRFGFTYGMSAIKNTKAIEFNLVFNIEPYLHPIQPKLQKIGYYIYDLFAVVCHLGNSLRSGHYVTYAKAKNNLWYCFDDEHVSQVKESQVLNLKHLAYILFYSRRGDTVEPNNFNNNSENLALLENLKNTSLNNKINNKLNISNSIKNINNSSIININNIKQTNQLNTSSKTNEEIKSNNKKDSEISKFKNINQSPINYNKNSSQIPLLSDNHSLLENIDKSHLSYDKKQIDLNNKLAFKIIKHLNENSFSNIQFKKKANNNKKNKESKSNISKVVKNIKKLNNNSKKVLFLNINDFSSLKNVTKRIFLKNAFIKLHKKRNAEDLQSIKNNLETSEKMITDMQSKENVNKENINHKIKTNILKSTNLYDQTNFNFDKDENLNNFKLSNSISANHGKNKQILANNSKSSKILKSNNSNEAIQNIKESVLKISNNNNIIQKSNLNLSAKNENDNLIDLKSGARLRLSQPSRSQFGTSRVITWDNSSSTNIENSNANTKNTKSSFIVNIPHRTSYDKEYDKGKMKKFKKPQKFTEMNKKTTQYFQNNNWKNTQSTYMHNRKRRKKFRKRF